MLVALKAMAATVANAEEEFCRIDAVAGDADHGRGAGALSDAPLPALGAAMGEPGRPPSDPGAIRAPFNGLIRLGRAKPGNVTMLYALLPFTEALSGAVESGPPLAAAWAQAASTARDADQRTAELGHKAGGSARWLNGVSALPTPVRCRWALA